MAKVINTYKMSGRLIDSLCIEANRTPVSIIQNSFLPTHSDCYSNEFQFISIIYADSHKDSNKIFDFLNKDRWPKIIILRRTSMIISLQYINAGALDCVSSRISAQMLIGKCLNIFDVMEKSRLDNASKDTRVVLSIDHKKRIVRASGGSHVRLTSSETILLGLLAERRSGCLNRDELLSRNITGNDATYRSLNVLVSRLRKKLEIITKELVIDSVRGSGYCLGYNVNILHV